MLRNETFTGTIGTTVAESTPSFEVIAHPGEEAPNVVVVVLDDLGFAHFGSYGSDIDTPNFDRLATGGLRYANFHVTPLCSPTRAAILTGRNHHTVGMRGISNFNTGFPHMRGHVTNAAATMAEVLREEGYATFAIGKWHLCQMSDASQAGPFDQWPLARGFDRFYGFMDGETDQFNPELTYDNHRVEPPKTADEGYHLSEDLIDHTISFIHDTVSIRPDRPFFCYLAFGATHAPHQAPAEYLAKYRGRFNAGWDEARARIFARQLELGLVPQGTELAPRNPGVEPWDELSDNQQRLSLAMQEAFAAFLDHTDAQLGRLLDDLDALGRLDNTIIMVMADNGASQEGGPFGVMHEMKFFNGILETPDEAISKIDDIGGPNSHTNYPWGWAQAGNTPFKWYKQNTHEGGVHVPLIVHWPRGISAAGEVRHQFTHAVDVAATVYDLLGVKAPEVYRGIEQLPVAGESFAQTFDSADAAPARSVQYFEMFGHRGLWADGWKAVTRHNQLQPFSEDTWELYHVDEDFSEVHDLSASHPEKLQELIDLWFKEAERHGVLPLDDRGLELFGARFADRSPHPLSRIYRYYPPVSPMPSQVGAALGGRNFDVLGHVNFVQGDGGVLYATGTQNAGLSVFVEDGKVVFDYNAFGDHAIVESAPLSDGPHVIGARITRTEGMGGIAAVLVDGEAVAEAPVSLVMRVISSVGSSIAEDVGSAVSERYRAPNAYRGALSLVEVIVAPSKRELAQAEAESAEALSRQ